MVPCNTAPRDMGPNSLPPCPENPADLQCGDVHSGAPEGGSEAVPCGRATKALPRDPLAELAERLRSLSEADRKRLAALLATC
jgi:hypothetical protein